MLGDMFDNGEEEEFENISSAADASAPGASSYYKSKS